MSVEAATIEQVLALAATVTDCGEFAELETREEIFGFLIAMSRAEGWNEVEVVEIVARASCMSPAELRRVRDILRKLGYVVVSRMLTELARKSRPARRRGRATLQ